MKKIVFCILLVAGISSCKKEDALLSVDNISGLGGDTWVKTNVDKWIYDSLTVPFNSTVFYKYNQFELVDLDRTVVPIKEENVIPVMSAIKKMWIDTYIAETSITFFKKYGNKFFVLLGSGSYDLATGAANLGTASEDGTKINIYQLNYFKTKLTTGYQLADSAITISTLHIIEHEFAHVLHKNILYPFSFPQVGARSYTSDWTNLSDAEAISEGFISRYAISGADDDFAEMVSLMLTMGKNGFDNFVSKINYTGTTASGTTAAVAQARLRLKESIVVGYFKQSWNIDFYSLQARTRAALSSYIY